jgi:RNA polymerase-binding transcription factor DksA
MATKKKAAKPAKRSTPNVKKIAPPKKAAAKPAHSSGAGKATKKAPVAKSIAKPVSKKVAPITPAKKTISTVKKPTVSNISKPTAKPQPAHPPVAGAAKPVVNNSTSGKVAPKEEVKRTVVPPPPPVQVKPEVKKPAPPPAKPIKVVIPEMKTKTVRKYEPEFTKSVLDTPQEDQTGPTMRYSDAELGEFRELINRKLDAAKKELAYLQGLITRKDEMGGDNDDARYMTMEDGSMSMEREQLSQMASRQITFIDHLEKALMRIENKTYGICRVTGKLIDKARLRAVPHATLSIEAKQMMNK